MHPLKSSFHCACTLFNISWSIVLVFYVEPSSKGFIIICFLSLYLRTVNALKLPQFSYSLESWSVFFSRMCHPCCSFFNQDFTAAIISLFGVLVVLPSYNQRKKNWKKSTSMCCRFWRVRRLLNGSCFSSVKSRHS